MMGLGVVGRVWFPGAPGRECGVGQGRAERGDDDRHPPRAAVPDSSGLRGRGIDPLNALIASIDGVFTLMLTDPIVRGAIRLLNDPGVWVVVGLSNNTERPTGPAV